ncbi:MAG TPA: fused MFS/spermidine synthase [Pyrinomonadaceae bacterium]
MSARISSHTLLFGVTIFVSAALLFSVEPMIAKMLLPVLGGTPAVWNTCMVFFQAALLAGYGYALMLSRWSLRTQLTVQLLLLTGALISLPIGLSSAWISSVPASGNPSTWLLACLAATVGVPFFVISSNSPILQKWFSHTGHSSAKDPYFLYSASNAGSLLALLAYPALMEPHLTLKLQSTVWSCVYLLLLLLMGLCALLLWRCRTVTTKESVTRKESEDESEVLTVRRRVRWVLLAFVPSSLMLGVTNYITVDIASAPLLWIIPLALYLLSLIFAFAQRQIFSLRWTMLIIPGATLVLLLIHLLESSDGARMLIVVHLLYFFLVAFVCHRQLAADRPRTSHLSEFYVWFSVGGVVGGIFNALIAPLLFRSVIEYPLVMLLACLLLPRKETETDKQRALTMDFVLPTVIFILTFALGFITDKIAPGKVVGLLFVLAVPLFVSYPFRRRPLRFALALGAVMLGSGFITGANTKTIHSERNFFGVLRVTQDANGSLHSFLHGTTVHGRESMTPERQCEPLSYHHRSGPLGSILRHYQDHPVNPNIAVVGLGAGAAAAYSKPDERWTFYEINPAVVSVARDTRYFRYMGECAQAPINVVLGDARLKLREAAPEQYGLILIDAFSSDAIPVHLMTQEAVDLYMTKLAPGGWLVLHISNRNLDLSGVVADLARSRNLTCLALFDKRPSDGDRDPSKWVVLSRKPEDSASLKQEPFAEILAGRPNTPVWTDDFSNILSVFKWR